MLRSLEDGIADFPGCMIVVSHDRWFLDRVATHILAFEPYVLLHSPLPLPSLPSPLPLPSYLPLLPISPSFAIPGTVRQCSLRVHTRSMKRRRRRGRGRTKARSTSSPSLSAAISLYKGLKKMKVTSFEAREQAKAVTDPKKRSRKWREAINCR